MVKKTNLDMSIYLFFYYTSSNKRSSELQGRYHFVMAVIPFDEMWLLTFPNQGSCNVFLTRDQIQTNNL